MFSHIITLKTPDQWEFVKKEAEERMHQDLTKFTPIFVHWNDIKLDTVNPVEQITNAALWQKMRVILYKGRAYNQILVIQISPENLFEITGSTSENCVNVEVLQMKQEILSNSTFFTT